MTVVIIKTPNARVTFAEQAIIVLNVMVGR
jgi:hypothetical protein